MKFIFLCVIVLMLKSFQCIYIIQGLFPPQCGYSLLIKKKIFNSIKEQFTSLCNDTNISFKFGEKDKHYLKKKRFKNEYNIVLYHNNKSSLVATSHYDSDKYFNCLYNGTNCDTLSQYLVNITCDNRTNIYI